MISYLYCDRYSNCNGFLVLRDEPAQTDNHARAKGWHIWEGETQSGRKTRVCLCSRCVESHRRNLAPAPVLLPEQEPLQLDI